MHRLLAQPRNLDLLLYAFIAMVVTVVALIAIPRNGYLAWGDVYPLYLMPGNSELQRSLQLWSDTYSGLGSPHYAPATVIFALWGDAWLRLGVSGPVVQWLLTLSLLLFWGLSVAFFTRTLFVETRLAALAAGLALPLSFYSALTFHDPIATFANGYFPFSAAFIMTRLRTPVSNIRFAIEIGFVSLGFMVLATAPPIAVYALLWVMAWLIGGGWYWRSFSLVWPGLALGAIAAIAVNAWWAYAGYIALFASGGATVQTFADPAAWSWVHQRATITHLLSMRGVWSYPRPEYFPWAQPYQFGFRHLALYVPAGLALVGLVLCPFRRRTATLFAIILVSLFMGKGYHAPLGQINAFLYARLPFYWLFRDPQQVTNITLYLSMFVLAGVGISEVVKLLRRMLERVHIEPRRSVGAANIAAGLLVLLLMTNGIAFLSGDFIPKTWLNGDAKSVVMPPHYWKEAADYLNAQPDDSRVLVLPNNDFYQMPYDWGYYGADGVASALIKRPVLLASTQSANYVTGAPALNQQFTYLVDAIRGRSRASLASFLSALNVGWILQRNDIVWSRPLRDIASADSIRQFLTTQPGVQRVATFGELDIYRVAITHGIVSASNGVSVWRAHTPLNVIRESAATGEVPWVIDDLPSLPRGTVLRKPHQLEADASRLSSSAYTATFSPSAHVLVLHSTYSTGWQPSVNGKKLAWTHLPIDGFLNGWIVPAGAPTNVVLSYAPARLYAWLEWLAVVALCVLAVGLVLVMLPIAGTPKVRAEFGSLESSG